MYYLTILCRSSEITSSNFWEFKKKALQFLVQKIYLFYQQKKNVLLKHVVNSEQMKQQILENLHKKSDHQEKEETYQKIIQQYWWKELYNDIKKHCCDCAQYQHWNFKQFNEKMHSIWTSTFWEKMMINTTHMFMNQEKHYIIEAWNSLSEWFETRALASLNSESVVKFL